MIFMSLPSTNRATLERGACDPNVELAPDGGSAERKTIRASDGPTTGLVDPQHALRVRLPEHVGRMAGKDCLRVEPLKNLAPVVAASQRGGRCQARRE